MGHGGKTVGRATPEPNNLPIRAHGHLHKPQVILSLDVDRERLEAIESLRNGGDVQLTLYLWSTLEEPDGNVIQQQHQELAQINQGVWVRLLEALGYRKYLLVEIEVPSAAGSSMLNAAVMKLQKAQQALAQGEYRDAVGTCRDVLEEVTKALKDDLVQVNGKPPTALDKAERLFLLRRALKNVTHPARHSDEVSANIEWSRRDAISIVTMTAAVLVGLDAPGARPVIPPPAPASGAPSAVQLPPST